MGEALEARAQASEEMASMAYLPEGSTSVSEIEKEFLLLESSEAVEDELQKLKTNLLLSGKSTGRSSKVGGSQTKENRIFDPSVEWEFERLKPTPIDRLVKFAGRIRRNETFLPLPLATKC